MLFPRKRTASAVLTAIASFVVATAPLLPTVTAQPPFVSAGSPGLVPSHMHCTKTPGRALSASTPVRHVMIGASVTRVSAKYLRMRVPGIRIDAVDARSWDVPGARGGTTLWQAFVSDSAGLGCGDWLIVENSRVDVPVAMNQQYTERLLAWLPADVCVEWIIPHDYFDSQGTDATQVTAAWNAEMALMIHSALSDRPCHAFVEWDTIVSDATFRTPNLTPLQRAQWQPLLYDGRHPTPAGRQDLARSVAGAMLHPLGAQF